MHGITSFELFRARLPLLQGGVRRARGVCCKAVKPFASRLHLYKYILFIIPRGYDKVNEGIVKRKKGRLQRLQKRRKGEILKDITAKTKKAVTI